MASTYFPIYAEGFDNGTATSDARWANARGVIVGTLPPVVHEEAFAKLADIEGILVRR